MNLFVIVNEAGDLGPRQTTSMLIASLLNRNCQVQIASVDGFEIRTNTTSSCFITATQLTSASNATASWTSETVAAACAQSTEATQPVACQPGDLILIRTNPGRDPGRSAIHSSCLHFCQLAEQAGVHVVNQPGQLERFASKASLALLPERLRPAMLVSSRPESIASFVADSGRDCVIKPLIGSRGENVVRVKPGGDVARLLTTQFERQPVVAQHYLDAAEPGDKRVVVAGGDILQDPISGIPAGIKRIPADGDFRANLHAGGQAVQLTLTEQERGVATEAAKLLNQNGIWLAGIDLIDAQIIEFNVFSTGGLYDAQRFSGLDFAGQIADQLLHKLT